MIKSGFGSGKANFFHFVFQKPFLLTMDFKRLTPFSF